MSKTKFVTIMVIPDDAHAPKEWKVRLVVLQLIGVGIGLVVLGIVLFFVFYGTMVYRTAMAERLQTENDELRRYKYKVRLLEENLNQAHETVRRLTRLAGIDYKFPEYSDSAIIDSPKPVAAILDRPADLDPSLPAGLPLRGFISQGFQPEEDEKFHPGIDIACAKGTPVLATGSGQVEFAGSDETYGWMVVIKHNDSTSTLYGHNDSLLVKQGEKVAVGSRIALSGSSGKSTAPHLHYEIRINEKPIDPLENPYDKENLQQ
ncbi:MAG: M23 family metallopeptidase [bacterium]|nr:M23 family metallopeptidase [bacterium]